MNKRIINTTIFKIIDVIASRLYSGVAIILLGFFLNAYELGIYGVVTGYFVIIALFNIEPTTILFRDYSKFQNQGTLFKHLSAYIKFIWVRTGIFLVITSIASIVLYFFKQNATFSIYLIIAIFVYMLTSFQSLIKEYFFISLQQGEVTIWNAIINGISLVALTTLYFFPTLISFAILSLVVQSIASLFWYTLLKRRFNFKIEKESPYKLVKESLKSFGLWQHLAGNMTNFIYNIDTVILGFFVSLTIIGNYTIALQFANLFFVIPMVLQKGFSVSLSREKKPDKTISSALIIGIITAIGQLVGFLTIGRWALTYLFPTQDSATIFSIAVILIIAATILNAVRPIIAYITIKGSVKNLFLKIYLPITLISLCAYAIGAWLYGFWGVAWANIFNYTLFSIFLITYTWKKLPFRFTTKSFWRIIRSYLK